LIAVAKYHGNQKVILEFEKVGHQISEKEIMAPAWTIVQGHGGVNYFANEYGLYISLIDLKNQSILVSLGSEIEEIYYYKRDVNRYWNTSCNGKFVGKYRKIQYSFLLS